MSIKPFEKVLMLAIAAILVVSSAFSSVGAVNAGTSMFEKGTSMSSKMSLIKSEMR
ncbi:hypothetical protein [Metaplanococcus flavidus]|uniref:Uncharacterized protein n=1 Tax=Metaplanococcus flavidus TaxID=569883 RepID=A0ABW3LFE0_9BACL